MALKPCNAPQSTCSQRVHFVFNSKKLPSGEVKLNLHEGDQLKPGYLKLNPQWGCAHAAPYLLVLIFGNSTFTVDDFCPRLPVAKRMPPPTTITINAPTRTPSTPTPPLLPSAMVLSSLHQQGGYAAPVVLVPRLIFCADRQFFRGEQGDQAAALVGNDDLFLYARGGEAVGCRAIGFDREHHSFLDFGRVVHRYDAGDDRPLVQV